MVLEVLENIPQINEVKPKRCQHVTGWTLENTSILIDYPQKPPRTLA
jgi:hypothetical protein